MVVLTIIANSNDHTVHFKEPLGKFQYIRLLSCSFHNSWHNLKRSGEISIYDEQNNATVKRIHTGNYTLRSLGKELEKILDKEKVEVKFDHEKGVIFIDNPLERKIHIDRDLTPLLGLIEFELIDRGRKLKKISYHQSVGFIQQLLRELLSLGQR